MRCGCAFTRRSLPHRLMPSKMWLVVEAGEKIGSTRGDWRKTFPGTWTADGLMSGPEIGSGDERAAPCESMGRDRGWASIKRSKLIGVSA